MRCHERDGLGAGLFGSLNTVFVTKITACHYTVFSSNSWQASHQASQASLMQTLTFRRLFEGGRWRTTTPPVASKETNLPINTTVHSPSWWWAAVCFCGSYNGSLRLDNGALLTVIAGFLLHGGYGAIFMSQEKLLQPSHFVSQQGDFALWGQKRQQNRRSQTTW